MEEGGREGVRFGRRTIVPSILLLLETTTPTSATDTTSVLQPLGRIPYCQTTFLLLFYNFLLLWLIHYRLNYCLLDTAPSSKFSNPPSPDYPITLFSPPPLPQFSLTCASRSPEAGFWVMIEVEKFWLIFHSVRWSLTVCAAPNAFMTFLCLLYYRH